MQHGFIQAVVNKTVDSQKIRTGLWHKSLLLIIILLGFTFDFAFNLRVVSKGIAIIIIAMEIISILENLKKAGINIGKVGNVLAEKTDKTVNENLTTLINTIDENLKD